MVARIVAGDRPRGGPRPEEVRRVQAARPHRDRPRRTRRGPPSACWSPGRRWRPVTSVDLFIAGDGVGILRPATLDAGHGIGTGSFREHVDALVAGGATMYASGMSSKARGLGRTDLGDLPVTMAPPDRLVGARLRGRPRSRVLEGPEDPACEPSWSSRDVPADRGRTPTGAVVQAPACSPGSPSESGRHRPASG